MLAYWPALLGVLLLLRLVLSLTEEMVPLNNAWQKARIRQGLEAISKPGFAPADGARLVLMFGASEALLGFSPKEFDEQMAGSRLPTRSYNLAFQNTGTMIPLYLARMRHELRQASVRASLILVAIPLPRLTRRARENYFSQTRYHDIDAVFFDTPLWEEVNEPLSDKLILLFNKWVLGERSLVQLHRTTNQLWQAISPWHSAVRASADPFYKKDIHPEPAWDPEARGGYYLNIERRPDLAAAVIAAAQDEQAMRADLRDLIRCCDVLELRFDEAHLEQVATAVRSLHEVADRVAIVTYPESPRLRRRPDAEARAAEALHFIADRSGAELWDAAPVAGLAADLYFDHSHFTPEGVRKHVSFVAQRARAAWGNGGTKP